MLLLFNSIITLVLLFLFVNENLDKIVLQSSL